MASQEVTEANPEKMYPVDHAVAILGKMETTDLKADPEEMESEEGRCHSETTQRTEEAAQGPASSCRAMRRAERTYPRRLWIPGEVGCHLQEVIPSYSSGMVHGMDDIENTSSSIVACWTVFTEMLSGLALIKSVTIYIVQFALWL
jgi:hypothetical protein